MLNRLFLLICMSVILWGSAGCKKEPECIPAEVRVSPAEQWLNAVKSDDAETALKLAQQITGTAAYQGPSSSQVKQLFQMFGILPAYADCPVNREDYTQWRRAYLFYDLAQRIADSAQDPDEIVKRVTKAVENRIANGDNPEFHGVLYPEEIWRSKGGFCDRQAWVCAMLFTQLGFDAYLIMLKDEKGVSPHTFAEIRKDGRAWLIDTFCKAYYSDMSFAQMRKDPEQAKAFWKDPSMQSVIARALVVVPAFPQDYCPRNQLLSAKVHAPFRFAEDPFAKLEKYVKETGENPEFCSFWEYPFSLMLMQLQREIPFGTEVLPFP